SDDQSFAVMFNYFVHAAEMKSSSRHTKGVYWRGRLARVNLRKLILRRVGSTSLKSRSDVSSHLFLYARKHGLNADTIPDHLLALMIATRETTASLITWQLIEMAHHREAVESIRPEAELLLSNPTLLTDQGTTRTLRAVLTEIERLHSP